MYQKFMIFFVRKSRLNKRRKEKEGREGGRKEGGRGGKKGSEGRINTVLETHQWLWSRCGVGRSFETRRRSSKG